MARRRPSRSSRSNNVSRRFGDKLALDDVSFRVPAGSVVGLVGENGAGKTTLIKHILGLLKAQSGSVRVFGLDPVADPVGVLSRIGYLSEEPDMPGWMRVHELIRYVAAFYPTWDHDYAEQLRREFGLDPNAKVKQLSKGQRARAGLLVALAYRPELLLLDEPSSGLDPIVRRDILGAIIRTIADEGRTVLFSSHLLAEVERVSDQVAMIKSGRILFCDSLDRIKQSHARLTLHFAGPQASRRRWPARSPGTAAAANGRPFARATQTSFNRPRPPSVRALSSNRRCRSTKSSSPAAAPNGAVDSRGELDRMQLGQSPATGLGILERQPPRLAARAGRIRCLRRCSIALFAEPLQESEGMRFLSYMPLVVSIILAISFCNFTDRNRRDGIAGFPRHLFALPVNTALWSPARWLCSLLSVVGIYVAWATLVLQAARRRNIGPLAGDAWRPSSCSIRQSSGACAVFG